MVRRVTGVCGGCENSVLSAATKVEEYFMIAMTQELMKRLYQLARQHVFSRCLSSSHRTLHEHRAQCHTSGKVSGAPALLEPSFSENCCRYNSLRQAVVELWL
jgi:hypothetical protein